MDRDAIDSQQQQHKKSEEEEKVEQTAAELSSAILDQFTICSELSAIDLSTMASMNKSVQDFHSALHERVGTLLSSARSVQRQASAAQPVTQRMSTLLQKAKQLEAIIDRLDEYTAKQEAALSQYNVPTTQSLPTSKR